MAENYSYGHSHFPENCGLQHGTVTIVPVADTPTSIHVEFDKPYTSEPTVVVSAVTSVLGSTVKMVSVSGITETGCDIYVYRTNTTLTAIKWIAVGTFA